MQRVTYYDSTLKQYVLVGNEHDTLTALGKLEDSLEKLEPKTFGEFMTRFRQRCISNVICGSSPYQP